MNMLEVTKRDERVILEKLNAASERWKHTFTASLDSIPLKWSIADQILHLDGIWICPVQYLAIDKLDTPYMDPVCLGVGLVDGEADIIIIPDEGHLIIHMIKRNIRAKISHE